MQFSGVGGGRFASQTISSWAYASITRAVVTTKGAPRGISLEILSLLETSLGAIF